ncbi:MAG: CHASE3 domain-containing protein [Rubrivivax sp.]
MFCTELYGGTLMVLSPDTLRRLTSSRYLGPLTVVLAVSGLAVNEIGYQSLERLSEHNAIILEARALADQVRLTALMMEAAKRGFIITERETFLEPYTEMSRQFEPLLARVKAMSQRYPEQRERLEALAEAARRKKSEMEEVLRRFQAGNRQSAVELTLTEIGRENMVRISEIADEIRSQETAAYNHVQQLRGRVRFWNRIGITGLVLLGVAAVFAVLRLNREREKERARYVLELRAERDNLEVQVDRRTRELTHLAQHLQRVREEERGHLARDLHDELGGLLTAAKLDVARVKRQVDGAGAEVAERIQRLSQTLDAGIALKRRIIEDLRPSSLDNLGLQRTLEIQCAEFAQRSEIRVQTEISDLKLDPERALAVYRVVQEALTNVAKYAQAKEVRVLLQRVGERARLRVQDDGRGFDPKLVRDGSHGLAGMRFRLRSYGGDLVLHSAPGQGTTIEATLPVEP